MGDSNPRLSTRVHHLEILPEKRPPPEWSTLYGEITLLERMNGKLQEYMDEGNEFPRAACIIDMDQLLDPLSELQFPGKTYSPHISA